MSGSEGALEGRGGGTEGRAGGVEGRVVDREERSGDGWQPLSQDQRGTLTWIADGIKSGHVDRADRVHAVAASVGVRLHDRDIFALLGRITLILARNRLEPEHAIVAPDAQHDHPNYHPASDPGLANNQGSHDHAPRHAHYAATDPSLANHGSYDHAGLAPGNGKSAGVVRGSSDASAGVPGRALPWPQQILPDLPAMPAAHRAPTAPMGGAVAGGAMAGGASVSSGGGSQSVGGGRALLRERWEDGGDGAREMGLGGDAKSGGGHEGSREGTRAEFVWVDAGTGRVGRAAVAGHEERGGVAAGAAGDVRGVGGMPLGALEASVAQTFTQTQTQTPSQPPGLGLSQVPGHMQSQMPGYMPGHGLSQVPVMAQGGVQAMGQDIGGGAGFHPRAHGSAVGPFPAAQSLPIDSHFQGAGLRWDPTTGQLFLTNPAMLGAAQGSTVFVLQGPQAPPAGHGTGVAPQPVAQNAVAFSQPDARSQIASVPLVLPASLPSSLHPSSLPPSLPPLLAQAFPGSFSAPVVPTSAPAAHSAASHSAALSAPTLSLPSLPLPALAAQPPAPVDPHLPAASLPGPSRPSAPWQDSNPALALPSKRGRGRPAGPGRGRRGSFLTDPATAEVLAPGVDKSLAAVGTGAGSSIGGVGGETVAQGAAASAGLGDTKGSEAVAVSAPLVGVAAGGESKGRGRGRGRGRGKGAGRTAPAAAATGRGRGGRGRRGRGRGAASVGALVGLEGLPMAVWEMVMQGMPTVGVGLQGAARVAGIVGLPGQAGVVSMPLSAPLPTALAPASIAPLTAAPISASLTPPTAIPTSASLPPPTATPTQASLPLPTPALAPASLPPLTAALTTALAPQAPESPQRGPHATAPQALFSLPPTAPPQAPSQSPANAGPSPAQDPARPPPQLAASQPPGPAPQLSAPATSAAPTDAQPTAATPTQPTSTATAATTDVAATDAIATNAPAQTQPGLASHPAVAAAAADPAVVAQLIEAVKLVSVPSLASLCQAHGVSVDGVEGRESDLDVLLRRLWAAIGINSLTAELRRVVGLDREPQAGSGVHGGGDTGKMHGVVDGAREGGPHAREPATALSDRPGVGVDGVDGVASGAEGHTAPLAVDAASESVPETQVEGDGASMDGDDEVAYAGRGGGDGAGVAGVEGGEGVAAAATLATTAVGGTGVEGGGGVPAVSAASMAAGGAAGDPAVLPISGGHATPGHVPSTPPASAPATADAAPASVPISAPAPASASAPVSAPVSAPISTPVSAPTSAPVSAPHPVPTPVPHLPDSAAAHTGPQQPPTQQQPPAQDSHAADITPTSRGPSSATPRRKRTPWTRVAQVRDRAQSLPPLSTNTTDPSPFGAPWALVTQAAATLQRTWRRFLRRRKLRAVFRAMAAELKGQANSTEGDGRTAVDRDREREQPIGVAEANVEAKQLPISSDGLLAHMKATPVGATLAPPPLVPTARINTQHQLTPASLPPLSALPPLPRAALATGSVFGRDGADRAGTEAVDKGNSSGALAPAAALIATGQAPGTNTPLPAHQSAEAPVPMAVPGSLAPPEQGAAAERRDEVDEGGDECGGDAWGDAYSGGIDMSQGHAQQGGAGQVAGAQGFHRGYARAVQGGGVGQLQGGSGEGANDGARGAFGGGSGWEGSVGGGSGGPVGFGSQAGVGFGSQAGVGCGSQAGPAPHAATGFGASVSIGGGQGSGRGASGKRKRDGDTVSGHYKGIKDANRVSTELHSYADYAARHGNEQMSLYLRALAADPMRLRETPEGAAIFDEIAKKRTKRKKHGAKDAEGGGRGKGGSAGRSAGGVLVSAGAGVWTMLGSLMPTGMQELASMAYGRAPTRPRMSSTPSETGASSQNVSMHSAYRLPGTRGAGVAPRGQPGAAVVGLPGPGGSQREVAAPQIAGQLGGAAVQGVAQQVAAGQTVAAGKPSLNIAAWSAPPAAVAAPAASMPRPAAPAASLSQAHALQLHASQPHASQPHASQGQSGLAAASAYPTNVAWPGYGWQMGPGMPGSLPAIDPRNAYAAGAAGTSTGLGLGHAMGYMAMAGGAGGLPYTPGVPMGGVGAGASFPAPGLASQPTAGHQPPSLQLQLPGSHVAGPGSRSPQVHRTSSPPTPAGDPAGHRRPRPSGGAMVGPSTGAQQRSVRRAPPARRQAASHSSEGSRASTPAVAAMAVRASQAEVAAGAGGAAGAAGGVGAAAGGVTVAAGPAGVSVSAAGAGANQDAPRMERQSPHLLRLALGSSSPAIPGSHPNSARGAVGSRLVSNAGGPIQPTARRLSALLDGEGPETSAFSGLGSLFDGLGDVWNDSAFLGLGSPGSVRGAPEDPSPWMRGISPGPAQRAVPGVREEGRHAATGQAHAGHAHAQANLPMGQGGGLGIAAQGVQGPGAAQPPSLLGTYAGPVSAFPTAAGMVPAGMGGPPRPIGARAYQPMALAGAPGSVVIHGPRRPSRPSFQMQGAPTLAQGRYAGQGIPGSSPLGASSLYHHGAQGGYAPRPAAYGQAMGGYPPPGMQGMGGAGGIPPTRLAAPYYPYPRPSQPVSNPVHAPAQDLSVQSQHSASVHQPLGPGFERSASAHGSPMH